MARSTSSIVVTPAEDFQPGVFAKAAHAVCTGRLADFPAARSIVGQLANGVGRHAQLVNALSAFDNRAAGSRGNRPDGKSVCRLFCNHPRGNPWAHRPALARTASLHFGQSDRTSRWAITASTVLATRNGSTPMSTKPRVGAGGVVGVQRAEHQVAGERGLDRVFGRFQIADFADEHDVRVVTQNGAQRGGERQADLRMNLNLVDAVELVFDRVFGRDDLGVFVLDFDQRAVERRRFAGAGRAGDEDDAVRQSNQLAELCS